MNEKPMRSPNIQIAADIIKAGGVVAMPTETVYGLGANALNPIAVARIFELKQRPSFDPLIVHIADMDNLNSLMVNLDERVYMLAERFWPGPLTMVLPKSDIIPDIVTSGLSTVGIRMPANDIALDLILSSGCPIAAPSANRFGHISPTTAEHVRKQLPDVDFILDGGSTNIGIESTIIRLTDIGFQILRKGIITKEDIESLMPYDLQTRIDKLSSPGQLKSHYSPRKPFLIADTATLPSKSKSNAGLISFSGALEEGFGKVIRLSQTSDLKEYAAGLFGAMHSFEDDPDISIIFAEPVLETGIGLAIMDRLRKAEFYWKYEHSI